MGGLTMAIMLGWTTEFTSLFHSALVFEVATHNIDVTPGIWYLWPVVWSQTDYPFVSIAAIYLCLVHWPDWDYGSIVCTIVPIDIVYSLFSKNHQYLFLYKYIWFHLIGLFLFKVLEDILLVLILYDLETEDGVMMCMSKLFKTRQNPNRLTFDALRATNTRHQAYVITTNRKCAVCVDPFKDGESVIKLGCRDRHMFHQGCLPGLTLCPLCNERIEVGYLNHHH